MKNKFLLFTVTATILVSITFVRAFAQISFKANISLNPIRVDEKISFNIEIKNIGPSKKRVLYPYYQEQVFSFLKEEGGDVWYTISSMKISDDASTYITLKPNQSIEQSYSLFPNILLLPNKKYNIKIIYCHKKVNDNCFDPSKSKQNCNISHKEQNLVLETQTLSKSSEEEWIWLEKHHIRRLITSDFGHAVNDDIEDVKEFIKTYPQSIFINKVKLFYIQYITYQPATKILALDKIEESIRFCFDIKTDCPEEAKKYLLLLEKRKASIKN
jgi:hypothetical protein